jgi:integrase
MEPDGKVAFVTGGSGDIGGAIAISLAKAGVDVAVSYVGDSQRAHARLWTVPADRMKGGREHRVPLSDRAVAILTAMLALQSSEFVFPGTKAGRPLSVMALEMVLRRAKIDATVHGFRSSFRDWTGERTAFPRELAEAALAHLVGDEVERAYRRGDALEKRRALMAAWAEFCASTGLAEVVTFARRWG